MNGRAKPSANRHSTRQRKINSKIFSSRLLRVTGGGVMRLEFFQIVFARGGGIDVKVAGRFQIVKQRRFFKVKAEFRRVEHLKQKDFVAAGAQAGEVALQSFDGREQVGDQHHER